MRRASKPDEWTLFRRADAIFRKLGEIDFEAMLKTPKGFIEFEVQNRKKPWLTEEMADAVITAFDGDRDAFVEIDERPGRFHGGYPDWFWAVRRVRNSPNFGRKLFESFK